MTRKPPIRHRFFEGDGLLLAADTAGEAADVAPIIFLHGGGQSRRSWRRAISLAATAGHYAVVLDLRGHGDSDWAIDADSDEVAGSYRYYLAACSDLMSPGQARPSSGLFSGIQD